MSKRAGGVPGHPNDVADALALGEVVRSDDGNEVGRPGALNVVGHREAGVGEQVTYQEMDVGLLD